MIEDFIFGMATAVFGGVLALMGLPSRLRTRLPSLQNQPGSRAGRVIRTVASILAVAVGLPIAIIGLAMVWASLSGVEFALPWWPPEWWPFVETPPV